MSRIAILETDLVPDRLYDRHGSYTEIFSRMLSPQDASLTFGTISLVRGAELPEDPSSFDGYLITGSRHAAYDDIPWIGDLQDFVLRATDAGAPVVGICFGHQVMARAFGGRVEKSEQGWNCGFHTYCVAGDEGRDPRDGEPLVVATMHQDQVVEAPRDARLIATSDGCRLGGFAYDAPALSFQFHPEFDTAFMHDLLDLKSEAGLPADLVEAARRSLELPTDREKAAAWIARFLRTGGGRE